MTEKTTDVAKREAVPGAVGPFLGGQNEFIGGQELPGDFRPPEYRYMTARSASVMDGRAHAGTFYCRATHEEFVPGTPVVVLRILLTRTAFASEALGAPVCQSLDRLTPRPGGLYPGPCRTCEMRAEHRGFDDRDACKPDAVVIACFPDDPERFFILRWRGLAYGSFAGFLSLVKLRYKGAFPALQAEIGAGPVQTKLFGGVMVPNIGKVTPLLPSLAARMVVIARAMAGGEIVLPEETLEEKFEEPEEVKSPEPPAPPRVAVPPGQGRTTPAPSPAQPAPARRPGRVAPDADSEPPF